MRNKIAIRCLSIIFLVSAGIWLRSQDFPAGILKERLQVYTDRTLYISGEKILFSAFIYDEEHESDDPYSQILYCELIAPDGNQINKGKYLKENLSWQGCIQIPDETITGIYYLKSYTRYMRNGGPDGYLYIMLKIINPYKTEVLTSQVVEDALNSEENIDNLKHTDIAVFLSPDKRVYSPREVIKVKIAGETGQMAGGKMCLAVIPEYTYTEYYIPVKWNSFSPHSLQYYPETRGISLTGKLLDDNTGKPIVNALVNLSIIGDKDAMAIRTDSSGRYFFALPGYTGNRDIFLCSENIPEQSPEIFIENDFCPQPVKLPSPSFHLTEEEKTVAFNLALNQKINEIFTSDTQFVKHEPLKAGKSFYGEPTSILEIGKYIDLPTIEEYFNELPVEVKVRKSQGRKHFRFNNTRIEMTIYDPLVL